MVKVYRCSCGEVRVVNDNVTIILCGHCGEYMQESSKRTFSHNRLSFYEVNKKCEAV